MLVQESLV